MAADTSSFTKLVPGFEFLQGLVKNAGAALPGIGQWVAPTLNPEELEKRIEELRTVQFWLEQNARMLGATIQALEVQRMTLATLKTMNVQMEDLRESLKIKMPTGGAAAPAVAPEPAPAPPAAPRAAPAKRGSAKAATPAPAGSAAGMVDPMQWWGALTKQFTQLAATAMKDTATDAAKNLATTMVKQSFDAASQTLKSAVEMPAKAAAKVAGSAARTAGAARQAAGNAAAAARQNAGAASAESGPAPAPAKRTSGTRKRSGAAAPVGAPRSSNS
jgi:hypothetical protein